MKNSLRGGMKVKKRIRGKLTAHLILLCLALICLLPFVMVLINSFKKHKDIVRSPLMVQFTAGVGNYMDAWRAANFSHTILNSLVYTASAVLIVLFCSILAAYVLAGRKVKGTGLVMMYFMFAMTVPVQLFLVPLYKTYAKLGLLGNLVAVSVIQAATNLPLAITLLRTFFLSIPTELEEAARMDGAGTLSVIRYIILPVISPGIITVSIIVALNTWNEFLVSSTFLIGEKNFTAMLALLAINGQNTQNYGLNLAATVTLVGPIIIFFLLIQRKFIDGIVSGSVKG